MNEIPQMPLKDIAVGLNPRQHASKTGLQDLTASVKQSGVLEPILVRPNPNGNGKGKIFLLVCGERRYHASLAAGLATIPAITREMTDEQALETQIIENLQREDVHFLDEAQGFARLLAQGQSQEDVAVKVGKSLGYVASRLSLARLIKPFHAYAYRDQLPVTVALRLSRLTAQVQKACMEDFTDGRAADVNFSMGEVDSWLNRHVYLQLAKAPFDTADANLVPKAGSCQVCPKRSGANKLLFSDFKEQDVCTDPACYESKCKALIQIRCKEHPEAVQIAHGWMQTKQQKECDKAKILREFSYDNKSKGWRMSKKDECPNTVEAIVAMGEPHLIGKLVYVCTVATCKVHTGTGRVKTVRKLGEIDPVRAKQQEELWQRRTRHAVHVAIHTAVREHQSKEKDAFKGVPLEALRLAVTEACKALRPMQDGVQYLETLWIPGKGANQADRLISGPIFKCIAEAKDHATLLRVLLDYVVADDVGGKYSPGELVTKLAKAYELDLKAIAAPVEKDWNERKAGSYAKRNARLAKERAKVKKAKPETEALAKK